MGDTIRPHDKTHPPLGAHRRVISHDHDQLVYSVSFIVVAALLEEVRFIQEGVLLVLLPSRQNEATTADRTRHVNIDMLLCHYVTAAQHDIDEWN